MNLVKKGDCNSILEIVERNLGKTMSELESDATKNYSIDKLSDVAKTIKDAVFDNTRITIVGDYDCDGVTSSAILTLLLNYLGCTPTVRLPKRFSEGYGLSENIIDEISDGLLITVDNGITAYDAVKKAKDKGLKVIIIDHHLGPEDGVLPPADIIIDPNAIDNSADFNGYCGAGLSYKLAQEMIPGSPLLPKLCSLAAIGTIADVMVLSEDNRNIVKNGLKFMTQMNGRTTGLYALLNECCLESYVNAKNIAFKIAPILNAPGRLYDDGATKSYELLSFDGSITKAVEMAQELIECNTRRQELVKENISILEDNIKENCLYADCPMTIYQPGLPEGLVGIFAGRIAEEYGVPCIVLTDSEDDEILKGSARSAAGIHLKNILDKHSDLIERYGGHAEAAGLSIKKENLEKFRSAIQDGIEINSKNQDDVEYDLEIAANEVTSTIRDIEKYGPFGEGNPEPKILIRKLPLYPMQFGDSEFKGFAKSMGDKGQHLKLAGNNVDLVGFDMVEKYRAENAPKCIDVLGNLSKNSWHAKITNQIEIADFENAEEKKEKTNMAARLAQMAAQR